MNSVKSLMWSAVLGLSLVGCKEIGPNPGPENAQGQAFYPAVAQTISLNQELLERQGEPVQFGASTVRTREGDDHAGSVLIDVELSGPKGDGRAQVKVSKANDKAPWVSKGGDFFPGAKGGPPVHLPGR
jgi:hypothetical protein